MKEIPSAWAQTTLGNLTEYVTSGSRDWSKYYAEAGALFVRTQDINTNKLADPNSIAKVFLPASVEGKRTLIRKDDLLITITGANVGRCAHVVAELPEAYVSQSVALVRLLDQSLGRFVHLQLLAPSDDSGKTSLEARAYGMGRPVLNLDNVRETPLLIPPRQEQQRIANKLDTVLTRVDAVNTRLARVAPILKRFRQSVLAAATSGRLTEDWRNTHQLTALRAATLGEIVKVSSGDGLTSKEMNADGGIPVYGGNGVNGFHDKANVFEPTIVIGRVGFYCGSVHLTPSSAWVTDNALRVRFDQAVLDRSFLYYALLGTDLRSNMSSTAQPVISGQKIYPIVINVPSVPEQAEIVRRVETLFAFADRLEARLKTVQTGTERLTPALLAKAFRGELVPQDPNDEPASELLHRLQQEAPSTSTKRGRKSAA